MEGWVERCKRRTVESTDQFLTTFSFVPEDKLHWSPAPTAKSAMRIANHTAYYAGIFAQVIKDGRFPTMDREQHAAARKAAEEADTTREEVISLLRKNTDEVLAALDALTPEMIESTVETPAFPAPMTFFMDLPAGHADGHASQIDYLQTCWDDQEVHF
jgi:uncharacterized damage-inducible protein DinB